MTAELWDGPRDPGDYGPRGEFTKSHLRLGDMRFCTVSGLFPGDRARAVACHTAAGPLVEARVILVSRTYLTQGGVWNLEGSYED